MVGLFFTPKGLHPTAQGQRSATLGHLLPNPKGVAYLLLPETSDVPPISQRPNLPGWRCADPGLCHITPLGFRPSRPNLPGWRCAALGLCRCGDGPVTAADASFKRQDTSAALPTRISSGKELQQRC